MEINKLKTREKILTGATAMVLILVLTYILIIEPQIKQQRVFKQNLLELQRKLLKMNGDLLVKDRIEKTYSDIEHLILTEGTEQQQISAFTRQLNDMYANLNIKIRSVKILPSIKEPFYTCLSIRVEMVGHIKDFLRFITDVSKCTIPIRIEQLDLNATETRDNIHASVKLSKIVAIS